MSEAARKILETFERLPDAEKQSVVVEILCRTANDRYPAPDDAELVEDANHEETVRFLNQFTTGYGNYTEEREALFKNVTLDQILAAMRKP